MNSNKLLCDLFQAYYDARKNKRSALSSLAFEVDYEKNLFGIYQEITERRYEISPSFCFISKKPILREVFAADFRDRVVHHLVYNYISPFFERLFIHDSYSCRKGKGTSCGIKRVEYFIRSCSKNYQDDCYILKLDISGYFMSIDHFLLYAKVNEVVLCYQDKAEFDVELVRYLIKRIIFHDPTINCVIKGNKVDWVGLPKSKSLFYAEKNKGLPIGNLTSQLFGNVYLNEFDHFVKYYLGCNYYGRYVDDFVIVHRDKEYLKSLLPVLSRYLQERVGLQIHPRKIYLQHYANGVPWLGVVIKPYRKYIRNRTKGNLYNAIKYWNNEIQTGGSVSKDVAERFVASMNSYLGMLGRLDVYNLRQKAVRGIDPRWYKYVLITASGPFVLK